MHLEKGAVNSDITVDVGGGQTLSAVITNQSVETLDLEVGERCCALIKSSHVLLAVSD
jgi:molybdate transport system regulatory protein